MRLFFGLPLPSRGLELAEALRTRLDAGRRGLRWLPPDSLHLTLVFLGEQDSEGEAVARSALEALAAETELPRNPLFRPRSLALLPDARRPRVLALIDRGASELGELHTRLCRLLGEAARRAGLPPLVPEWPEAGLPESRPPRPLLAHCSLARIGAGADRPPFPAGEPETAGKDLLAGSPDLTLDRLLLYESRPGEGGPRYIPRAELRLAADRI